MQTLLDKFRNIAWTAGKTAVVATTTAAALTGGAIATDQAINPYSQLENNIQRAVLLEDGVVIKRSFDVRTDRPEFVMHRNGKEGLSMSYNSQTKGNRSAFSKKLKYKTNNETVEILPYQGTTTQGVKMNVVLQSQPATSTFYFDVPNHDKYLFNQGTSTIFAFQKEGYHPLKNNVEGYKIHEPLIYDSNGNEVYGDLIYKNGQIKVVVPEKFLDSAVYPVVVDPLATYNPSGQVSDINGLVFRPNGENMYLFDDSSEAGYQYSLSTAWDISTASYDSKLFSFTTEDSSPTKFFIGDSGNSMYLVGNNNDAVFQYSLSTSWDISSASYDSISFPIGSQETGGGGIFFKGDGTRMYIEGGGSDSVHQYNLSTSWDISSASYSGNSYDYSSEEGFAGGLYFRPNGENMYIDGNGGDAVFQYNLSTAWDISTASYSNKSYSIPTVGSFVIPYQPWFKDDGSKLYIAEADTNQVQSYTVCTAWDVSTAQETSCPSGGGSTSTPQSIFTF